MTTTTHDTFLVQLTDLHIREPGRLAYGRIDTAPYLERAVQSVLALRQAPRLAETPLAASGQELVQRMTQTS